MASKKILEAKAAVVSEISDKIKASESVIIFSYQGLTVAEFTELRRNLKDANGEVKIYKNTLVKRALNDLSINIEDSFLEGPNAIVFSKDTINGPKVIAKFAKKHENLVIKGGLVEGKMMNADQIKVIASLPGREGLISMFLSCLQAPIRNFACAVKAVAEKN